MLAVCYSWFCLYQVTGIHNAVFLDAVTASRPIMSGTHHAVMACLFLYLGCCDSVETMSTIHHAVIACLVSVSKMLC